MITNLQQIPCITCKKIEESSRMLTIRRWGIKYASVLSCICNPDTTTSPYRILSRPMFALTQIVPDLIRSTGEIGMASRVDRATKGVSQPQQEVSRTSLCRYAIPSNWTICQTTPGHDDRLTQHWFGQTVLVIFKHCY